MSLRQKVEHEVTEVALTTLFFAAWLGGLILFKTLVLDQYHIHTRGLGLALFGALVLAKVVLVMEHVPLGAWLRRQPPVIDLTLRTAVYGLGVLVVLLLEKAFEARHEYGGFAASVPRVLGHRDAPHVWANALAIASALLMFNLLATIRRLTGASTLLRPLFARPPTAAGTSTPATAQRPAPTPAQVSVTGSPGGDGP